LGRTLIAEALIRLERVGLVRAQRARLTMAGLVVAQRLAPLTLRAPYRVQDVNGTARPSSPAQLCPAGWLRATGT
jgi:hypothetical protein